MLNRREFIKTAICGLGALLLGRVELQDESQPEAEQMVDDFDFKPHRPLMVYEEDGWIYIDGEWYAPSGAALALGDDGYVYHSYDGGLTWKVA